MSHNLSPIEQLIAAHINAVAEHDRLFKLQDWRLVPETVETAALDPLDDALVALCAARPATPRDQWLRQKYLTSLDIADKIEGCRGLTESVLKALIGPEPTCPIPDASPIMDLFQKWNASRDAANEYAERTGCDDAHLAGLFKVSDGIMMQLAALPAVTAADFAAKLISLTHYGAYDDLGDDKWALGSALIREAAALVGHPEHVENAHREPPAEAQCAS